MQYTWLDASPTGLLPDTQDCGLRMGRESRYKSNHNDDSNDNNDWQ